MVEYFWFFSQQNYFTRKTLFVSPFWSAIFIIYRNWYVWQQFFCLSKVTSLFLRVPIFCTASGFGQSYVPCVWCKWQKCHRNGKHSKIIISKKSLNQQNNGYNRVTRGLEPTCRNLSWSLNGPGKKNPKNIDDVFKTSSSIIKKTRISKFLC